jgi:hypothetical protein
VKKTASFHVALVSLAIGAVLDLHAQDTLAFRAISKERIYEADTSLRMLSQDAFKEGERLVFDVGYSFITAGEAVMSVPKIDTLFGRQVYQALFTVASAKALSWLYKVDDRYETFLDAQGIFPWHFTQRVREGGFSRDSEAWFDQIKNIAYSDNKQYPIPPYVHDAVSAFYYVRTLDYSKSRVGEKIILQNFFKDTTYALSVKFLGRQRIEVDAGTFDCIIIEPLMKEGGLFKSEGRVLIWMTDDERKIPVKVSTKIVIGSIESELREYSGINGPIRAKVR